MNAILPGATVGVLGSGQLGRMFAIAARRMGYRVHTLSPLADTPTGQISDKEFQRPYEDLDAIREFARGVSVVTFEFENVPAETVEAAAQLAPVRPAGSVLYTTQNRLREKNFLARRGFPLTRFRHVASPESFRAFFFQAEDGIRVADVTGVQTCALPISTRYCACISSRSEERRVGKECRSRWSPYH